MIKNILFDLDGTLTDPGIGITNSVMHALREFGITVPGRESLYCFIGPPLADSFAEVFGFSPEQCELAIRFYRAYFREKGLYENTVYPGIPELLTRLSDAGFTLGVATSKPEEFALRILEHFSLLPRFRIVSGASMDGTVTKKADVIRRALERAGMDAAETLMVGDRRHDAEGAALAGLRCVGVLYGYGTQKELETAGAAALAENPEALFSRILSLADSGQKD